MVWTNLHSNEHLQAISLLGPSRFVVNSSSSESGSQRFETQPDAAHSFAGIFANISIKGMHPCPKAPFWCDVPAPNVTRS